MSKKALSILKSILLTPFLSTSAYPMIRLKSWNGSNTGRDAWIQSKTATMTTETGGVPQWQI